MDKEYDITVNYVFGWRGEENTGFVIGWGAKNFGFGELTIKGGLKHEHCIPIQNEWHCDSEGLSRNFVKQILSALGDVVKLDHEEKENE